MVSKNKKWVITVCFEAPDLVAAYRKVIDRLGSKEFHIRSAEDDEWLPTVIDRYEKNEDARRRDREED